MPHSALCLIVCQPCLCPDWVQGPCLLEEKGAPAPAGACQLVNQATIETGQSVVALAAGRPELGMAGASSSQCLFAHLHVMHAVRWPARAWPVSRAGPMNKVQPRSCGSSRGGGDCANEFECACFFAGVKILIDGPSQDNTPPGYQYYFAQALPVAYGKISCEGSLVPGMCFLQASEQVGPTNAGGGPARLPAARLPAAQGPVEAAGRSVCGAVEEAYLVGGSDTSTLQSHTCSSQKPPLTAILQEMVDLCDAQSQCHAIVLSPALGVANNSMLGALGSTGTGVPHACVPPFLFERP